MAGVPGTLEELPLNRLRSALPLLLPLLLFAGPLAAQEGPPPPRVVQGFLEVAPRVGSVRGSASPLLEVGASLGLGGRWRAGGTLVALLGPIDLGIPAPLQPLELDLRYWGLTLERSSAPPGGARPRGSFWSLGALLATGNVDVRDAATGARLQSDNFLALEPSLSLRRPFGDRLALGTLASYRLAFGVGELRNLRTRDLHGWSLGLRLSLGPF